MNIELISTILKQAGIGGLVLILCYWIFKSIIGKVIFTNWTPEHSSKVILRIVYIFAFITVLILGKLFYEDLNKISQAKTESQIKLNKNSVPFFSTTNMIGDLSDTTVSNKFNNFILENQGEVVKLEVAINTIDTNIKINFSDENMKENPYFVLEDEFLEYRYVIERNEELYNVRTSDSGFLYITGYFAVGNQTVPHHKYSLGDGMATIIGLRPIPAEKIIK